MMEQQIVSKPKKKTRVVVKRGREHLLMKLSDVVLFWVYDRLVFLFDKDGKKYLTDKNLRMVLEKLDEEKFFRVNRQAVINIDYIKSFKMIDKVRIKVELTVPDLSEGLIISQERVPLFREWVAGEW